MVLLRRNRRATSHRSHLWLIPLEKLFPGRTDILVYSFSSYQSESVSQRRPGRDDPHWKIPVSEWPTVLQRVEQKSEPLRQVAKDYGVFLTQRAGKQTEVFTPRVC